MNPRYCFEIAEDLSARYCFSFVDTEDGLASFLFSHLKVDVEEEMEFRYDDDPFRIVMCHIPRHQWEDFLRAIELLPGLMAYAGKEGYEEYCLDLMRNAAQFLRSRPDKGGLTPPQ